MPAMLMVAITTYCLVPVTAKRLYVSCQGDVTATSEVIEHTDISTESVSSVTGA